MPIYMKYGDIQGHITMKGHENWIECNSFQWGVGRGIDSPMGSGKDREATTPSVSEIVVTKVWDIADNKLLFEALAGAGKQVTIDFVKTSSDANSPPEPFITYDLENVLLSGYSVSSGGDRPTLSLSLNFTKITQNNLENPVTAEDGSPDRVSFDLSTGVAG